MFYNQLLYLGITMRNKGLFFFGILCGLYAFYGLGAGKIYMCSSATKYSPLECSAVARSDQFAVYWITISVILYAGFFCIKKAFAKKTELKKIIFKDIHEYRRFQKIDKSLSSITLIWGMVGLITAYPFWYLVGFLYNQAISECGMCKLDDDGSNLILGFMLILFPIIFYRVAFYRTINQFKTNETITENHFFTRVGPSNTFTDFFGKDSDGK